MLSFGYPNAAPGGVIAGRRFNVAGLPLWSAAVRRAQAGQGRAKLLCIGDSTTAGFGSPMRAGSWPRQLAGLLAARGGRETNLFSNHNLAPSYDPRMVRGAGWAQNSSLSLGGNYWLSPATPTPMTFTPQTAWDTFDYYAYGGTTVVVTIGAGTPVTVTPAMMATVSGSSLARARVTVADAGLARGAHSVSVQYGAASVPTPAGFDCFDAATGIDVLNLGVSSWKSGDFTGTVSKTAAALPLIAPDLTLINLGISDFAQPTPTTEAVYKANIQSLIDKARVTGDVELVIFNDTSATYSASRAVFAQYVRDLAATNGLRTPPDLMNALGTYAVANGAGDMLDTLNPSAQGYGKIAALIRAKITG